MVHPVVDISTYRSQEYHAKALTGEYRADSFSTRRSPLAGQYAGGIPAFDGFGSCSMTMYCWIRSRQLARRKSVRYVQVHEDVSQRTLDLEIVEVLQPPEDEAAETNFPRDDSATRQNRARKQALRTCHRQRKAGLRRADPRNIHQIPGKHCR